MRVRFRITCPEVSTSEDGRPENSPLKQREFRMKCRKMQEVCEVGLMKKKARTFL